MVEGFLLGRRRSHNIASGWCGALSTTEILLRIGHHRVLPCRFGFFLDKIVSKWWLFSDIPDSSDLTSCHLRHDAYEHGLCLRVFYLDSELFGECFSADVIVSIDFFFEDVEGMLEFETLQKLLYEVHAKRGWIVWEILSGYCRIFGSKGCSY
jgi:hypothetical protein